MAKIFLIFAQNFANSIFFLKKKPSKFFLKILFFIFGAKIQFYDKKLIRFGYKNQNIFLRERFVKIELFEFLDKNLTFRTVCDQPKRQGKPL